MRLAEQGGIFVGRAPASRKFKLSNMKAVSSGVRKCRSARKSQERTELQECTTPLSEASENADFSSQ